MKTKLTTSYTMDVKGVERLWREMAELLPMDTETKASARELGKKLGVSYYASSTGVRLFRMLGMIDYRSEYTKSSQAVYYSRLTDVEDGVARIERHFASGKAFSFFRDRRDELKPRKVEGVRGDGTKVASDIKHWRKPVAEKEVVVALATNPEEETRAIVGPEAETAFTELKKMGLELREGPALLEAARQYIGREKAIIDKMAELESLGITIDREAMRSSIKMDSDPVLEAVAALLPEWDSMVKRVNRLSSENADWKGEIAEKRRKYADMERELHAQKDANRRLSERNVALQQAATSGSR